MEVGIYISQSKNLQMQCMYINTNAVSCQALFRSTSATPFNSSRKDSASLSPYSGNIRRTLATLRNNT